MQIYANIDGGWRKPENLQDFQASNLYFLLFIIFIPHTYYDWKREVIFVL